MIQLADKSKALGRLEIAFRACPDDFDALKRSVQAGLVSLYDIRGDGYDVTLAGEVVGDSYFLWAVSGTGVIKAINELSPIVKKAGLTSISASTYFPSLARLVRRLSTREEQTGEITLMTMRV
ncbi:MULTISPECIES: DNAase [Vibrio]|uniref:DNAase n=1 Tax=Vibrio TaxID=662 RepID=UPI00215CCD3E|nr:DNAase [Vibrio metoecus]ELJ8507872.1 DNAase [Vibrio cholerae]EMC2457609.1 DNAase [Vibrio cholerae]MCR9386229.1 DNAase [Vibrio metoecus]